MSSCFYCGSNEHSSNGCVQKVNVQDIAVDAINQLGYSSMPRIVELFSEHKSGSPNLVSAAIYELSYEFRREYYEEMWQKNTTTPSHRPQGGNLLDYVISVTRGFVDIESDLFEVAISEFEKALSKAPTEVYEIRARLLKAQAQYATGDVDGAVLTILEGLENIQQLSIDSHRTYDYQLSRYYATKSDFETSINYLKQLVEGEEGIEGFDTQATQPNGDKRYFVKALIDEHFDNSREAINEYLEELLKKRKHTAQEMMELAQAAIGNAKEWEVKVEDSEAKLEQARQQFDTESYYGYLDAQSLAQTSKDIATLAQEKQRETLLQNASEAQKGAGEAMTPAQGLLERLGNPQKQLELFHEQFQRYENAESHLAESRAAFTLDNYSGYISSREEAEKAIGLANEIQRDVTRLLKCEEETEEAIANAKAALQIFALQYPEDRRENIAKYKSAEALLIEAKQYFRKHTEEGYEQCLNRIQKVNQLIDELNQYAKLHGLRQETEEGIDAAAANLESIESQLRGQYDPHKFQFAQAKLEEARGFCELRTMEGYSRAIDCTREVNQLVDEMNQDVAAKNLKEAALRAIENTRAEVMKIEELPEKELAESRLNERFNLISEAETYNEKMCEQAIELTEEIKNVIKQFEEETKREKRIRKQTIITLSGSLGSGIVVGILGALFWNPAALLCFLVGGACYVIQVVVNHEKTWS
ncbi:hypothetical protein FJZ31_26175 [Candidatus Poribacteria bacterium]|nr:hypothetical protein [Candidatus Poribacteria bacterium]